MERWLPIAGHEGAYEVSDHGRVRSLDRFDSRGRKWTGQVLKPRPDKDGYLTFHTGGSPRRTLRIHRLVLLAFVGPAPKGTEALHNDGDPTNNRLANLRWGTSSENKADAVLHGTHNNVAKTHCPSGHAYDDGNTYFYPVSNHRACRECARLRAHLNRALKKVAA